jgi:hypothetical protein
MAFNGAFTISQGTDPSSFTVNDTSTGTDAALTDRQIYLQLADGTYLTPSGSSTNYIDFPLSAGSSITLVGILPRDYAISITVNWISSAPLPSPSTYTETNSYCFTQYSEQFYYTLTQQQVANPTIVNDTFYYGNKGILRTQIDSAAQAVSQGNDIANSQFCLDLAYNLISNSNDYF